MMMRRRKQRGFVLVTMGIMTIAMVAALGLSFDVGHVFIVKSETQAYTDAASLSAALQLDGKSTGITAAKAAVTATTDKWNFGSNTISAPTVEFASSSSGPWSTSPSSPSGLTYVRVTATATPSLYFVPIATGSYTQNVISRSVAAQIPITNFQNGLGPYTAVAENSTGPNFGLTVGSIYDIQWPQYNGTRANCDGGHPWNCFNGTKKPYANNNYGICNGDYDWAQNSANGKQTLWSVAQDWGSGLSGYWGSPNNTTIYQEVLDNIQLHPISIGENIFPIMTSGQKNAQATALDTRVNQDLDTADASTTDGYTYQNYLSNTNRNGRRLMAMPIVLPQNTSTTTVMGYGSFLLLSDGSTASKFYAATNGNDAFCAIYMGPFLLGGDSGGASGSGNGATRVALVE